MSTIRQIQTVKDGRVQLALPKQFWGQEVEIIVLTTSQIESPISEKKSLRGCLSRYANPSLIDHEKKAWQKSISEKYGHH